MVQSEGIPGDLVVHAGLFSMMPFEYYDHGILVDILVPPGDTEALKSAVSGVAPFLRMGGRHRRDQ